MYLKEKALEEEFPGMKPRLLADENTSHRLVAACWKLEAEFPIIPIADWEKGAFFN